MTKTVTDMVFRFAGTIAYSDRTSAPIEVTLAYGELIASPYSNLSDYATLHRDELPALNAFFDTLLPNTVPLTASATPSATKHVTDFWLLMTGLVAYSDNSQQNFAVEYLNGVTDFDPVTIVLPGEPTQNTSAAIWADMVASNGPLLTQVFGRVTTTDTAGAPTLGPATVNLNSVDSFVIFADTGITEATGGDVITGDMGTGPGVTHTAITGFTLALDGGGQFSTSAQVTGRIYAHDYSAPTPTKVTNAAADMLAAYNDAAGRTLPDGLNLGAGGAIGGLTLVPGLYKWTSGVNIPVSQILTLNGGPNDVWIFQISGALTTGANSSVVLAGGANADNIFWQVAGGVTIGANASFKGNILSATTVNLGSTSTVTGRLLAQTAVNMNHVVVTSSN